MSSSANFKRIFVPSYVDGYMVFYDSDVCATTSLAALFALCLNIEPDYFRSLKHLHLVMAAVMLISTALVTLHGSSFVACAPSTSSMLYPSQSRVERRTCHGRLNPSSRPCMNKKYPAQPHPHFSSLNSLTNSSMAIVRSRSSQSIRGRSSEKSYGTITVQTEKDKVQDVELLPGSGNSNFENTDEAVDTAHLEAIMRKVDYRVIPVLTALYLVSFLDRSNIGNARIAGMNESLGLSNSQYNMALTIFFFPYSFLEVPSNVVLKFLRPSIWLPLLVLVWGFVMTLMGTVKNYEGLLWTRFFLGVAEAGLFPAATYILTLWYCRHEMQTRLAIFYCAASIAGAFSGLLAFGIEKMDGIAGLEGWRWIFILEGLLTVALGILLPFLIIDSPEKARFLTKVERSILIHRLKRDFSVGGNDKDAFRWKYFYQAITDWKVHLSVLVFWGNTVAGYGFVFSLPNSIKELGFPNAAAQLLTIPVYVVALIAVMVSSVYSDRTRRRAPFIIYPYTLCAIGYAALIALPKDKWAGARYAVLFPIAIGLYPSLCGIIAWNANNLAGGWKRSIGIALQITIGNLGGVLGSNIYLSTEKPYYWTGYGVSLAMLIIAIASGVVLRLGLDRLNKQRDRLTEEEIYAMYTPEELAEMGDKSPLFRYTL